MGDTGLVHEDCVSKMRLISLVELGSNESGQIPYFLIKDTLQVIVIAMSLYKQSFVLHLLFPQNFYSFLRLKTMKWSHGLLRQLQLS